MKVSVVVPCFNEEEVLPAFWKRASAVCTANHWDYEIILVDDGSNDRTWEVIRAFSASDPHVLGVRLSRNHGQQLALSAGLARTKGDRILLIDADLQDPPELLLQMMQM